MKTIAGLIALCLLAWLGGAFIAQQDREDCREQVSKAHAAARKLHPEIQLAGIREMQAACESAP